MADAGKPTTGPEGQVQCSFEGDALELTGYTAAIVHLPVGSLRVKRKKKPEKDGGQVFYFVSPLLSSRVELYTRPDDIAGMETLIEAVLAAGAKPI
jgi:hypothetical protein